MREASNVPLAPDPPPHASARAQAGGTAMQPAQGRRLVTALVGAPIAWVVHFLGTYFIIALWCAARWPGAGAAIGVFTLLSLVAVAATGALAWRLWRRGQASLVTDVEPGVPESWDARMGERGARMSFLAILGLFMSAMFALLILLEGLPPLFTQVCPPTTMP